MVHIQAYRAPEPPSRIFPECVSFQMFDNSLSVLNFLINISEKPKATPTVCSNVYSTSWTLTFYSDSINLDLASLSLFIRITYDCFHDELKQVVWEISAIEGTTNNDCHQNIFQTAALSLTWNTEVRIQPICYSNRLEKFIHSYSSFPSAEV